MSSLPPHPSSTQLPPPPIPDLSAAPYTSAHGQVFPEPEFQSLFEKMDERVADLYSVCIGVAAMITADKDFLKYSGFVENIEAIGSERAEELRISSYLIAYKLLIGGWTWDELVSERFLIFSVKVNLRNSQLVKRLDHCCDTMLELGFVEEFLFR